MVILPAPVVEPVDSAEVSVTDRCQLGLLVWKPCLLSREFLTAKGENCVQLFIKAETIIDRFQNPG